MGGDRSAPTVLLSWAPVLRSYRTLDSPLLVGLLHSPSHFQGGHLPFGGGQGQREVRVLRVAYVLSYLGSGGAWQLLPRLLSLWKGRKPQVPSGLEANHR